MGIAGAVAVGKSTFAVALRLALAPLTVEVVATDGFLRPNEALAADGLLLQKGFPASYDGPAIVAFLRDLRAGRPASVPAYSHTTYDRVPGATRVVEGADVVVIEGVNALQPAIAAHLDLRLFIDAEEPLIRSWFSDRFLGLVAEAEEEANASSFYRRFVALDDDGRREVADAVWDGVNLVNLTEHILPTHAAADLVLTKTSGHHFSS